MANVFFQATKDALDNITAAFDFVHPLRASMQYTRRRVTELLALITPMLMTYFIRQRLILRHQFMGFPIKRHLLTHLGKNKKSTWLGCCLTTYLQFSKDGLKEYSKKDLWLKAPMAKRPLSKDSNFRG